MKTLFKSLTFSLLIAGLAGNAHAGALADVQIIDRNTGQTLQTWRHQGRLYVAGTPGNRYAVSLRNKAGGRILTVLSVDGINVVTGATAAAGQSGYVLTPGQSAEVAGWRKSMEEVAAFYFTKLPDSYAARTDRPENVGVIGVAVFNEYVPPPPPPSIGSGENRAEAAADSMLSRQAAKAAAPAPAAEAKLGTGHGERIASHTEHTEFRRQSGQPNEVITIYYDSRANLVARGIIPTAPRLTYPNPFPGSFVPDPKS